MMRLTKPKPWPTARLVAFIVVALAAIYSVNGVNDNQRQTCEDNAALRADLAAVLRGAGDNERAQLTVINRLATPAEKAKLAEAFEPGLAKNIARVEKGARPC